jgi:hypothetical protein
MGDNNFVPCPRCKGGASYPWLMEHDVGEPCALCDQAMRVPRHVASAYVLTKPEDGFLHSIRDTRKVLADLGYSDGWWAQK